MATDWQRSDWQRSVWQRSVFFYVDFGASHAPKLAVLGAAQGHPRSILVPGRPQNRHRKKLFFYVDFRASHAAESALEAPGRPPKRQILVPGRPQNRHRKKLVPYVDFGASQAPKSIWEAPFVRAPEFKGLMCFFHFAWVPAMTASQPQTFACAVYSGASVVFIRKHLQSRVRAPEAIVAGRLARWRARAMPSPISQPKNWLPALPICGIRPDRG